jgi:hypothetical protein
MPWKTLAVAAVSSLLLVGCVDGEDFGGSGGTSGFGGSGGSGGFGGSGGSNDTGLSLARDVCVRDVRDRGQSQVRIVSSKNVGSGPAYAQVTLESRRSGMSVNTNRWSCRFSYSTGRPTTTQI